MGSGPYFTTDRIFTEASAGTGLTFSKEILDIWDQWYITHGRFMSLRAYDRPCESDLENGEIYINVRDGEKYRATMIGSEALCFGTNENIDGLSVDFPATHYPNYQEEYQRLLLAMTYLRKAGHARSYEVRLVVLPGLTLPVKELSFVIYFAKRSNRDDVFGLNISRIYD